jgi:hypothetical protein
LFSLPGLWYAHNHTILRLLIDPSLREETVFGSLLTNDDARSALTFSVLPPSNQGQQGEENCSRWCNQIDNELRFFMYNNMRANLPTPKAATITDRSPRNSVTVTVHSLWKHMTNITPTVHQIGRDEIWQSACNADHTVVRLHPLSAAHAAHTGASCGNLYGSLPPPIKA